MTIVVFSGAALPAPYSILEVGPLGPAGGAAEGLELGYGAPGATSQEVRNVHESDESTRCDRALRHAPRGDALSLIHI